MSLPGSAGFHEFAGFHLVYVGSAEFFVQCGKNLNVFGVLKEVIDHFVTLA